MRRLFAALVALSLPIGAFAQGLTIEHVDLGAGYAPADGWDLHIHDETNNTEYAPDEQLLAVLPAAAQPRPSGASFNFIGVGAGVTYWRLPEVNNPNLLFLGVGAEEADPLDFVSWNTGDSRLSSPTGKWIKWRLVSVTDENGGAAPGHFSVWQSDVGGPNVFISTFDSGIDATDSVYVLAGGHQHFNWGFTAPGFYDVTFEVSSQFASGTASNAGNMATYRFFVNAPEPSSLALGLLALPALGLLRRRAR